MIKALLFDADGVVVHQRAEYFSQKLRKELSIPDEKINSFFAHEFPLCLIGKADLKKELAKRIADWNWHRSVDELLQYWFETEDNPNTYVLQTIQTLGQKGVETYLVSDQEKYRATYLLNNMHFNQYFDQCFFSCDVGYRKSDPNFFKIVLQKLNDFNPQELLFIDDDRKNLPGTQSLGIQTFFYENPRDIDILIKEFHV